MDTHTHTGFVLFFWIRTPSQSLFIKNNPIWRCYLPVSAAHTAPASASLHLPRHDHITFVGTTAPSANPSLDQYHLFSSWICHQICCQIEVFSTAATFSLPNLWKWNVPINAGQSKLSSVLLSTSKSLPARKYSILRLTTCRSGPVPFPAQILQALPLKHFYPSHLSALQLFWSPFKSIDVKCFPTASHALCPAAFQTLPPHLVTFHQLCVK